MKIVSNSILVALLLAATIISEATITDIPAQSYDSHTYIINEQFPNVPVDSNDGCGS